MHKEISACVNLGIIYWVGTWGVKGARTSISACGNSDSVLTFPIDNITEDGGRKEIINLSYTFLEAQPLYSWLSLSILVSYMKMTFASPLL